MRAGLRYCPSWTSLSQFSLKGFLEELPAEIVHSDMISLCSSLLLQQHWQKQQYHSNIT
jgi:hypothetical protein